MTIADLAIITGSASQPPCPGPKAIVIGDPGGDGPGPKAVIIPGGGPPPP